MKAIIKQVTNYTIEIDGKEVGTFTKGDEWNGMTEFKSGDNIVIVGGFDEGFFGNSMGNILGEPKKQELTMITASPEFISENSNADK